MAAEIVLSPKAWEDLEALLEYLESRTPAAADRYAREIPKAIGRLEKFPESGRIVPEFLDEGIRRWREILFEHLRIIYRLEGRRIVVVRIVDGRMLLTFQVALESPPTAPPA